MPIRPIRRFPDSILTKPCRRVKPHDPHTKKIIQDLIDTMYASPGVGLAAPQIGASAQLSVIDVHHKKKGTKGLIILINPILIIGAGVQIPREGCLSVPDWLANVKRYKTVQVQTETLEGGKQTIKAKDFEALALQHEIDHLAGMLFLDRVANLKTDLFRRKEY